MTRPHGASNNGSTLSGGGEWFLRKAPLCKGGLAAKLTGGLYSRHLGFHKVQCRKVSPFRPNQCEFVTFHRTVPQSRLTPCQLPLHRGALGAAAPQQPTRQFKTVCGSVGSDVSPTISHRKSVTGLSSGVRTTRHPRGNWGEAPCASQNTYNNRT